MELKGLTPEEAAVFEWQYGYCGDFKRGLWGAIVKADKNNLYKLALGFPVHVEGYRKYSTCRNWWQEVQQKAIKLGHLKTEEG